MNEAKTGVEHIDPAYGR